MTAAWFTQELFTCYSQNLQLPTRKDSMINKLHLSLKEFLAFIQLWRVPCPQFCLCSDEQLRPWQLNGLPEWLLCDSVEMPSSALTSLQILSGPEGNWTSEKDLVNIVHNSRINGWMSECRLMPRCPDWKYRISTVANALKEAIMVFCPAATHGLGVVLCWNPKYEVHLSNF